MERKFPSVSSKLRSDNKTNDEFEIMLSGLTIEEMIMLKMELISKSMDQRLFGFPIFHSLDKIIEESILTYVHFASRSVQEGASVLGRTRYIYNKLLEQYKIKETYESPWEKRNGTNYASNSKTSD